MVTLGLTNRDNSLEMRNMEAFASNLPAFKHLRLVPLLRRIL